MGRAPEYQFFPLDEEEISRTLIAKWEELVGTTVQPSSPERLFLAWVTALVLSLRAQANWAANQNLPSRAEGENLDAIGEDIYRLARPAATAARCTARFTISKAQQDPVTVPAGTRVTDKAGTLRWALEHDLLIQPGETWAEGGVVCQTPGAAGNGYAPGQINTMVDLFDFPAGVENVTESAGGADQADDETYFQLMRERMDAMSSGGARGSYVYNAKRVSPLIGDVVANTLGPATVAIYVLMEDGTPAGEEIKAAVLAACDMDDARPMTDLVRVEDPERVDYDIDVTYYTRAGGTTGAQEVQKALQAAAEEYAAWQSGRLGRDINPEELIDRLRAGGLVKRLEVRSPAFTPLRDGKTQLPEAGELVYPAPQVAALGTVTLKYGGEENE